MRNLINLLNEDHLNESTGGIARRWIEIQSGSNIPFINTKSKEEFNLVDLYIFPEDPALRYEDVIEEPNTEPVVSKKVAPMKPLPNAKKAVSTTAIKKPLSTVKPELEPEYDELNSEELNEKKAVVKVSGPQLLNTAIQNVADSVSTSLTEFKAFGPENARAAIVVVMEDSEGNRYVYAKKVKAKRSQGPNAIFWQTKEFATQTNLWAQTAQMKKAAIPIEPTDFIDPGKKYNITSLIKSVKQGLSANPIVPNELKYGLPELLSNVLHNSTAPIPGLAEHQPAIEIKLSELAVPLALATGNFVTGDYETVNKQLLKPLGTSWQGATAVSFPLKAEKLIDAYMYFDEERLDISVKDSKGGGRPSTATIAETLNNTDFGSAFNRKYKDIIDAIHLLDNESAIAAPLYLAVHVYKVLDENDVAFLYTIYNKFNKTAKLTPNWKSLLKQIPYSPDTTHPEYQLGYHLLAVVARYVALQLNKDTSRITEFFKSVLNKSNLVQVTARTKTDKTGGLAYTQFNVTWPPVFSGTIQVDADSYTARTKPSRKISFSFNTSKTKKGVSLREYRDVSPMRQRR